VLLEGLPDTVRREHLTQRLGVSDRTLRLWMAQRGFPRPVVLSRYCHRWKLSLVLEWLRANEGEGVADA
jgi:predicted DNA-binding transcriptional regulator AlpA